MPPSKPDVVDRKARRFIKGHFLRNRSLQDSLTQMFLPFLGTRGENEDVWVLTKPSDLEILLAHTGIAGLLLIGKGSA
jgi:hypothetical protein